MRNEKLQSFIMVIFGATGDLMKNKLLPALVKLNREKKIGEKFYIVGFARRPFTNEEFRETMAANDDFAKNLYYQQGDFRKQNGYEELMQTLKKFDGDFGTQLPRFLYLATPPVNYEDILENLHKVGLDQGNNTRIIVEKPFGKDLETAIALDKKLAEIFEEKQIFRVDHYLGKETVQNILAFRFANGIFEPVWNKNYLDHVQITFAEKRGIEGRENFFDGVGILRDVGQNHLMQLIASVAMEQPKSFSKEGLRDERAKVIKALKCIEEKEVNNYVVRGQYENYLSEKNVPPDSTTETFVAMKFFLNTPRFENVPFYVRVGKTMPKNTVEISLVFLQTCHILFKEYGCPEIGNVLTIKIQPDEGIAIQMIAKKPGTKLALETVNMDFTYEEAFMTKGAEAYEKILLDIFSGDQMLFNRSDELSSSWEFITKILKGWSRGARSGSARDSALLTYKQGTWGPKEAQDLIKKDNRKWL